MGENPKIGPTENGRLTNEDDLKSKMQENKPTLKFNFTIQKR